jgi:hypothetical protein
MIAVMYSSGKIYIYKAMSKDIKANDPLYQLDLFTTQNILGANLFWRKIPDGGMGLFVFYQYVVRK